MKIPKSESKTVEFKPAFNQDTIVSLVAFANSDGGSVYVGVRDDGRGEECAATENGSLKTLQKSSQKSSQKILDLLLVSPGLTTQDLSEQLGISRRAVAKHIYNLQSSGHLRRVGPDKGGHWEVLEDGK